MPGCLFYYRRSVFRGEHLADLLHLPTDKLFREFRVMAGHIRIGVPQNLRQHVYRHSVLHGKAGERVAGGVRCQRLVDIADCRDLLEVGVHLVVARYRQHPAPLPAGFVRFVFAEQRDRIRKQRNPAHNGRFLSWFMNPQGSTGIRADMLRAQVVGICKGQSRQTAECEHVPNPAQTLVRHLFSDKRFQLAFCQMVFILVVFGFEFVVPKRIFFDPLISDSIQHKVFQTTEQVYSPVGLAVMRRLDKGIQTVEIGVIHGCK